MDQVQICVQQRKLGQLFDQVKTTTYDYWIIFYSPLFWFLSILIIKWELDSKQKRVETNFEFSETIIFPSIDTPIAPWVKAPSENTSSLEDSYEASVMYQEKKTKDRKLSAKRSFKTLKDQISSLKQRRAESVDSVTLAPAPRLKTRQNSASSLPTTKAPLVKKTMFLRRFSSSSDVSSDNSNNKQKVAAPTKKNSIKSESIQKLKLFSLKLKSSQ
ncbi:hypothetical protein CU097_008201 [Rhizopus azygosporus]|uniref:Uncharacterized protein n=1 Tax=Rhizopus azygosporus TaxID=86630 RepID=A0A367KB72_RHIAZ|nr:hypothetical protein CU097_008201 [Rhizopus azygosporus]CEJ02021.1 hypothetical protein RMCBS344292_16038 [Rhizopus microsporus]